MKALLIALTVFVSSNAFSQSNYVERLQEKTANEGDVVIHQDERLRKLLESDSAFISEHHAVSKQRTPQAANNIGRQAQKLPHSDTISAAGVNGEADVQAHVRRFKVEGYRIQIYAGNNSRKSRIEATQAGQRIKGFFPELSVYTHFYPPRWVCRVGDFRTVEEAREYLTQIRELKVFSAVTLIKTTVQATY